MAIQVINNGESGSVVRGKLNNNFSELDTLKAPIASPTFTGTPAAPTAPAGTNTTQVATTSFVQGETGAIASQAEAEAGTATTVRKWTPQRIKQAIDALAPAGSGAATYDVPISGTLDFSTLTGTKVARWREIGPINPNLLTMEENWLDGGTEGWSTATGVTANGDGTLSFTGTSFPTIDAKTSMPLSPVWGISVEVKTITTGKIFNLGCFKSGGNQIAASFDTTLNTASIYVHTSGSTERAVEGNCVL